MRARTRRTLTAAALVGTLTVMAAAGAIAATGGTYEEVGDARRLERDRTRAVAAEIDGSAPRNVILLVGDGMGDSEITIARNYARGAAGTFPGLDALPLTGQMTHWGVDEEGRPEYVSDSAATGTAWATGTKTTNGAVSVDVHGEPVPTILELAQARGLRTGNVSTAEIQDATPAVLAAHVSDRGCYGPDQTSTRCPDDARENGGEGSITEQILATRADVTLGGGAASFGQVAKAGRWKGDTLLEQAEDRGYQVVRDADGLADVRRADRTRPVLGLFARGNLPVRWQGPVATRTGGAEDPVRCEPNPAFGGGAPTLAEMTDKAIDLLNRPRSTGFFLQVEGASIDKQDHAANPCGQIGETVDLDEAVQVALEFAEADGDTLVIVTADHAHSSQIVNTGTTTPGLTRTLLTADGQPMTVAYGTSAEGESQDHTGAQVRVAAYGPRAANVVGLIDQTDLFFVMRDALRLGGARR